MEAKKKFKTRDVLLAASYFTKEEGYHAVTCGKDSTKERVLSYLKIHLSTDDLTVYQSRAEQAVQWIKNERSSDWVENIKSALSKKEVEEKAVGLISSLFSGYDSYLKRMNERNNLKKSAYQGQPKEQIVFNFKSFKILTKGKSKFNDNKDFYLTQIIDQSDNVYICFADRDFSEDLSRGKIIKAIVKSHNEREGVKQTVIDIKEIA